MFYDFVKSDDCYLIDDTYVFIIYRYIEIYIQYLKSPIDIFNCICVHTYIQDNKPSFEILLQHHFYSKVSFDMLKFLCRTTDLSLSYSDNVKMEKMILIIEEQFVI